MPSLSEHLPHLRRYAQAALHPTERTRLVRFVLVGASNTALTLLVYGAGLRIGIWYPIAAVLGYGAGIINGYTWNRRWTFRAGTFHLPEFSRYAVVQSCGLAANLLVLTLAVEALGMGQMLGEIVALAPIVLTTFWINRLWTFRSRLGTTARPDSRARRDEPAPSKEKVQAAKQRDPVASDPVS